MTDIDKNTLLRQLPGVDKILATPEVASMKKHLRSELVNDAVRSALDEMREEILEGGDPGDLAPEAIARDAAAELASQLSPGVQRCINATGVVLHTGLGRAVLPKAALDAIQSELGGYSVVSIDLEEGGRIRRESAIARVLAALTGAEAATIVNNNAAATVIALNTMAAGQQAILSRGQLVEIGGSFRMPDVFESAGVKLREVGTTNRTHLSDYENAIGEDTGLLLRVHPSNYRVIGFTTEPSIEDLVAVGADHQVPVLDDLGAGALVEIPPEPTIAASIKAGVDLVTCSGDKLIGGPQAGIILGRREWVDRVRRNPLFRALRVDKLTLTALEATLRLFLQPGGPGDAHPSWRMLHRSATDLAQHAQTLSKRIAKACPGIEASTGDGFSQVGSGSMPGESLPTTLIHLRHKEHAASSFARLLRMGEPPIYTRIIDETVCLDPRTVLPGEDDELVAALKETV